MTEPSEQSTSFPDLTPGQIVSGTLALLGTAAGFWFLYLYSSVLVILFAAIVMSTATQPLAERLARLKISRPWNVFLVYVLLILPLLVALSLGAPTLTDQAARIGSQLPSSYQTLREDMLEHPNFLVWRVARVLPEELTFERPPTETDGETEMSATTELFQMLGATGRALFALVAVLLLGYYWTLEGQRIQQNLLLLLPQERRTRAETFLRDAQDRLAAFVTGQSLLSVSVGAMAFGVYLLLNLPNALLLSLFAAVGEAIPVIGPALGAIPAALVAYSIEPIDAVWVIVATLVIQQVEAQLLVPRVMRRAVGVHPILTILALMGFGLLFGVAGALVAIPFAAILQDSVSRLIDADASADVLRGRDRMSRLRYEAHQLAQDVRKRLREGDDELRETELQVNDILEKIVSDLDSLLAEGQEKGRPSP